MGQRTSVYLDDDLHAVKASGVPLADLIRRGLAPDAQPANGTNEPSVTAADSIQLSDDQLERLGNLTPASGERHNEASMAAIDR
jgi:hypothetical protein